MSLTVPALFDHVGLAPVGPVRWRAPVPCSAKGVYVIAMSAAPSQDWFLPCPEFTPSLEERWGLTARWLPDQPVLYIGKTDRTVRHRLGQFYAHRFGQRSPHAGGQRILVLPMIENAKVFWAGAAEPLATERAMLAHFKDVVGSLPFANGTRAKQKR